MAKKGYVYILTNPSFREERVKIGRTSTSMEERLRSLNNTSIPLPFEVYATLKTESFVVIEKKLQDMFEDLANARVNKRREYFDIGPEKAFKYLEKEFETLKSEKGVELLGPDYYGNKNGCGIKNKKSKKGGPSSSQIYHFRRLERVPKSKLILKNGEYILKKGSCVCPEITSHEDSIKKMREAYKDFITNNKTTKDLVFDTPSAAGKFVYGAASNGRKDWIDDNKKSIEENLKAGI